MDAHVIDGYRFLMQNYRVGDKICIFGSWNLAMSVCLLIIRLKDFLAAPILHGIIKSFGSSCSD